MKIPPPGRYLWGLFLIVAGLAIVIFAGVYLSNMRDRARATYIGHSVSDSDGGFYLAKYYSTGSGGGLLRLYRARDGVLLAERMFRYGDTIQLFWVDNMLIYDSNDQSWFYDGGVNLPPSRLDQILAQLP